MSGTLARLKRRADFLSVAAARRKWVAPGLIVQARRRAIENHEGSDRAGLGSAGGMRREKTAREKTATIASLARVGFTVSRRVGGAVQRNRARRRLKAALASLGPDCVAGGVDVVVIGRTETLKRPFPDLIGDLRQAFERLGVWNEHR